MFLIRVYPAKSEIEGLGIFTSQKIQKDQLVWLLNPSFDRVWSPSEYLRLPSIAKENIHKYAFVNHDKFIVHLVDGGNFLNHSNNNNLVYKERGLFALKDIDENKELTINYDEFVWADPPK